MLCGSNLCVLGLPHDIKNLDSGTAELGLFQFGPGSKGKGNEKVSTSIGQGSSKDASKTGTS